MKRSKFGGREGDRPRAKLEREWERPPNMPNPQRIDQLVRLILDPNVPAEQKEDAWSELYPVLIHWACLVGERFPVEVGQDLEEEGPSHLYEAIAAGKFDPNTASLKTWAFQALKNLGIRLKRKKRPRGLPPDFGKVEEGGEKLAHEEPQEVPADEAEYWEEALPARESGEKPCLDSAEERVRRLARNSAYLVDNRPGASEQAEWRKTHRLFGGIAPQASAGFPGARLAGVLRSFIRHFHLGIGGNVGPLVSAG